MNIKSWENAPHSAMGSYYEDGKLRWQLFHRSATMDTVELGYRVEIELNDENSGKDWYREDVVLTRAYGACPGVPFADFLTAAG